MPAAATVRGAGVELALPPCGARSTREFNIGALVGIGTTGLSDKCQKFVKRDRQRQPTGVKDNAPPGLGGALWGYYFPGSFRIRPPPGGEGPARRQGSERSAGGQSFLDFLPFFGSSAAAAAGSSAAGVSSSAASAAAAAAVKFSRARSGRTSMVSSVLRSRSS